MHTNGKAIIETEQIPIKLWLKEDQMDGLYAVSSGN